MIEREWVVIRPEEPVTTPLGTTITTLQADVTFLDSTWRCSWGDGCTGIRPVGEYAHGYGCCTLGAYLTERDQEVLARSVPMLTPNEWEGHPDNDSRTYHPDYPAHGLVRTPGRDGFKTQVTDGACVFHNDDGTGCAFHVLADRLGVHPLHLKPEVCYTLPFRLEEDEDNNRHVLRAWERPDWGDPEWFDWWCVDDEDAGTYHPGGTPLYLSSHEVLTQLLGLPLYSELVAYMDDVSHHDNRRTYMPGERLVKITKRDRTKSAP